MWTGLVVQGRARLPPARTGAALVAGVFGTVEGWTVCGMVDGGADDPAVLRSWPGATGVRPGRGPAGVVTGGAEWAPGAIGGTNVGGPAGWSTVEQNCSTD